MMAKPYSPQVPTAAAARGRRFASARSTLALMLREMTSTYGRTPGGYVWAVLEPVLGILVLTVAFSLLFRKPPIGTSFTLFYATGVLPMQIYSTIAARVGVAVNFSRPLLVYPAVTFVDALIARFLVALLTGTLVYFIVMGGIVAFLDVRVVPSFGLIAQSLGLAALLGLGIGTLNAYLFMRIPVWQVVWGVISRPLFLISGVIYLYDQLPMWLRDILWYNPIVHVVGRMRMGFYASYSGSYTMPIYVILIALSCLVAGLWLLSWQVKRLMHES